MPRPSVWPLTLGGGLTLLLFGLISNLAFAAAGLLLMIWALVGWMRELARE